MRGSEHRQLGEADNVTEPDREIILKHYGYDSECVAPMMGIWRNDGTALSRLISLPDALGLYKAEQRKIRVIFDYDPDYPWAVLQIWGLPTTVLPDTGTRGETPES